MRRIPALTFVTLLLAAPALRAQESTTRGFNWGLHFGGATLTVEDGDRNDAGGGGIWLGYGFNRTVQLFVQLDGAQFDVEDSDVQGDWTMGHGDLGVRFHFANSLRSWVPYLQAALTGRVVGVDNPTINGSSEPDAALIGGGLTLGGGLLVYFSETFALDVQLDWTGGTFTQLEYGNVTINDLDLDATSTRFNLGLNWWP
ncbi:MAG: outer membrane beta-barrel protein [Gemmatimonadota bacterium]|jgi:hypothetical protein